MSAFLRPIIYHWFTLALLQWFKLVSLLIYARFSSCFLLLFSWFTIVCHWFTLAFLQWFKLVSLLLERKPADMDYGIFNVRTDVNACDGDTVRESAGFPPGSWSVPSWFTIVYHWFTLVFLQWFYLVFLWFKLVSLLLHARFPLVHA